MTSRPAKSVLIVNPRSGGGKAARFDLVAQCRARGIELRVERFSPVTVVRDEPEASFEVELAESDMTLRVPPDQSILAVLEAAGVSVLSSCREGTCGTCEVQVLAGTPEHRDSVLSPEERASNRYVMTCVSRSLSPSLTLDL